MSYNFQSRGLSPQLNLFLGISFFLMHCKWSAFLISLYDSSLLVYKCCKWQDFLLLYIISMSSFIYLNIVDIIFYFYLIIQYLNFIKHVFSFFCFCYFFRYFIVFYCALMCFQSLSVGTKTLAQSKFFLRKLYLFIPGI